MPPSLAIVILLGALSSERAQSAEAACSLVSLEHLARLVRTRVRANEGRVNMAFKRRLPHASASRTREQSGALPMVQTSERVRGTLEEKCRR